MSKNILEPSVWTGQDTSLSLASIGTSSQVPAVEAMLKEASFDRSCASKYKRGKGDLIPRIDADKEFAISGRSLQSQFINGENYAAEFLKAVIVADPKTHQQDFIEVVIKGEMFHFERRLNGTKHVWSLPLSDRERLARVMEWKLINGKRISAPKLDESIEFAISGFSLQSQFINGSRNAAPFLDTFIDANPKAHQQDFIEVNIKGEEFLFERRLNGVRPVWSLPLSDRERLAVVMEWELINGKRVSAPPLEESIEFAISGAGLKSQFLNGDNYAAVFLKTVIKADPKTHQQGFIEINIKGEEFRFERRLNGKQIVWSLPLRDRERLAGATEWGLINCKRVYAPPLDESIEFALSVLGLQAQFSIGRKKTSKFIKTVIKADPKTHQQDFIIVNIKGEEFRFERRLNGTKHVWSLPLSDRERLARAMGWELKNRRLHTGGNLAALAAQIQAITKHAQNGEKRVHE